MRDCNFEYDKNKAYLYHGRKSLQPECGIATRYHASNREGDQGRKSLQPECGIATDWDVGQRYVTNTSEEPAARMRDCNKPIANQGLGWLASRKSLEPECGIATSLPESV